MISDLSRRRSRKISAVRSFSRSGLRSSPSSLRTSAEVKPEIIAEAKRAAAAQTRGEVVSYGSKWCLTNSYPFFMQHSAVEITVNTKLGGSKKK